MQRPRRWKFGKENGSQTYLLCFLMEELLDISLTSGTIPAEHHLLHVTSACPKHSSNTATGEAALRGRSARSNSCTAGSSVVEDSWFYSSFTVKAGKMKDTAAAFSVCQSTRPLSPQSIAARSRC